MSSGCWCSSRTIPTPTSPCASTVWLWLTGLRALPTHHQRTRLHDTVAGAFFMPEGAEPMTQPVWLSRPIADAEFDLDLRALIRLRTGQLEAAGDRARVVVVQGGDTPDIINAAVGFRITGDQPDPLPPD